MLRLFLDGPAHGRVIDVSADAYFYEYHSHPPGDLTRGDVVVPRDATITIYKFGTYKMPRLYAWSPRVYLNIATPNGEPPSRGYSDIARVAHDAGFRDTEGRPV